MGKIKWTENEIRIAALNFKTKVDFQKNNKAAYLAAFRRNMLDDGITCIHMIDQKIYWTTESIRNEAMLFNTKAEFRKGSPNAYAAAKRRKLIDDGITCAHMEMKYIHWTLEAIRTEAKKYSTRIDFQNGSHNAYATAWRKGILDDGITCAHMQAQEIYWTHESVLDEALKYSTRSDFQNNSPKAYFAATRRDILNHVCCHMEAQHNSWTIEIIREEALKYNTRSDFQKGSPAYKSALKRGMLDDGITCSHMEYGITGFNPNNPGILYYLKLESKKDIPVYKIGITNLSVNERLKSMLIPKRISVTVIKELWFVNGKEAWELEKALHKEFKEHRYYGENIIRRGNNELYITDVLNYDTQQQAA